MGKITTKSGLLKSLKTQPLRSSEGDLFLKNSKTGENKAFSGGTWGALSSQADLDRKLAAPLKVKIGNTGVRNTDLGNPQEFLNKKKKQFQTRGGLALGRKV